MKYKPLDRYPYMENDLNEREGYVRNDVFAVYVEQVDAEFRDHNRRISYLEACCEDVPNTYTTKAEFNEFKDEAEEILDDHEERITVLENTTVTQVDFDDTVNDLQRQINNRVTFDIFDDYVEDTNERLDELEAFADDVPNTYATKAELTEYEETTDGRLDELEAFAEDVPNTYVTKVVYEEHLVESDARFDSIEDVLDEIPTIYATKAELADYEEVTDGRLDALESFADDVPNTYATKTELNEYKEATDDRLDILEDIADDLPNIYVNKTDFNAYTTATDETITEINHEIDAILLSLDNYVLSTDIATDDKYGIVKTDSEKGITLNEDGQLEINGRLGQSPYGGVYYPTTIDPTNVGNSSLLMSDGAKNLSIASRTLAILAGANLTCKRADVGATQYRLTNSQGNRFACFAGQGGNLAIDANDAATNGTAIITDISFANGNAISAYFGETESDNDIIITVDRTVNPNAATTKLRIYGQTSGSDLIAIGQGTGSKGGKTIALGQSCFTGGNQTLALGNSVAVTANNSVGLGHTHLVNKQFCFAAGQGHDFTDGPNGSTAVGIASKISNDTLFAVGNGVFNGNGNITRSNVFEVKNVNGQTVIVMVDSEGNDFNFTADTINTIDTRVTALENSGTGGTYYYKNLTVDNGGVGLLFENNGVGTDFHVESVDFAINNGFVNMTVNCKQNTNPSSGEFETPGLKYGPRISHVRPTSLIRILTPNVLNYDTMKLNLINFWFDIDIVIPQGDVYSSTKDFNASYFSEEALDMGAIDAIFNEFRVN